VKSNIYNINAKEFNTTQHNGIGQQLNSKNTKLIVIVFVHLSKHLTCVTNKYDTK